MALKLYNTFTRKVEKFKPIKKGQVKMYTCGPTVYDYIHIGNLRAYITADILKRTLEFLEYSVTHVTNITDVDDKTIKGSRFESENISLKEYTKRYIDGYLEDISKFNIKTPDNLPRATDKNNIDAMISMITYLLKKGIAYETSDGVYFTVKLSPNYGKFAGVTIGNQERIKNDEYAKETASDFALWKFHTKDDGNVFWDAPFGKGRPGWHIECSAMIHEFLGEPIDIHTGGVDLIFPHHTNEIAQTEAVFGTNLSNYWIHNEHLMISGEKMSKSLGNSVTARDILDRIENPLAFRYLLLQANYKQKQNFTWESLESAQNAILKLIKSIAVMFDNNNYDLLAPYDADQIEKFTNAMCDDLNTPIALSILWETIDSKNIDSDSKIASIIEMDKILGLDLINQAKAKLNVPEDVKKLASTREEARRQKDWVLSDEIRLKIESTGYEVLDTSSGQKVFKK